MPIIWDLFHHRMPMTSGDQGDLFRGEQARIEPGAEPAPPRPSAPLAARMRPRRLSEVVGQDHILRPGGLLPRLVEQNRFGSLIFYGPPGSGKTSIAEAIASETRSRFVRVNAVMSNVAELREVLAVARRRPEAATVLFIDELHRFNKAQQDLFLPDVEGGQRAADRRNHPQPGFLRQSSAPFAQPPFPPGTPEHIGDRRSSGAGPWPTGNGAWGTSRSRRTRRSWPIWPCCATAICAGRSTPWR